MLSLDQLASAGLLERLGWTIVHSLWQGILVAGLLGVALAFLRRRSAQARYLACCGALALVVALAAGTFAVVRPSKTPVAAQQQQAHCGAGFQPADGRVPQGEATPSAELPAAPFASRWPDEASVGVGLSPARLSPRAEAPAVVPPAQPPLRARLSASLRRLLPYIVGVWVLGVAAMAIWHLGGLVATHRLRRLGTRTAGDAHCRLLADLATRLGLRRSVGLMKSAVVMTPVVIGWLRPVILMPVGILTGMSMSQVEAILAHELAHIRRHDYLVNLLQTLVETLFFHHPAVWWISRRTRVEREHCCDDLAVAAVGNPLRYAKALAAVEEMSAGPAVGQVAMAMRPGSGSLLARIKRVVGVADEGLPQSRRTWVTGIVAAVVVALLLAVGHQGRSQAAAPGKPATNPTTAEAKRTILQELGLEGVAGPGVVVKVAYAPRGDFSAADVNQVEVVRNVNWDIALTPLLAPLRSLLGELPAEGEIARKMAGDVPMYRIQIKLKDEKEKELVFYGEHLQAPNTFFYADEKSRAMEKKLLRWTEEVFNLPAEWNTSPLAEGAVKSVDEARKASIGVHMKERGGFSATMHDVQIYRRPFTGGNDGFARKGELLWMVVDVEMAKQEVDPLEQTLTRGAAFVWIDPKTGKGLVRDTESFPAYVLSGIKDETPIRWLHGAHATTRPATQSATQPAKANEWSEWSQEVGGLQFRAKGLQPKLDKDGGMPTEIEIRNVGKQAMYVVDPARMGEGEANVMYRPHCERNGRLQLLGGLPLEPVMKPDWYVMLEPGKSIAGTRRLRFEVPNGWYAASLRMPGGWHDQGAEAHDWAKGDVERIAPKAWRSDGGEHMIGPFEIMQENGPEPEGFKWLGAAAPVAEPAAAEAQARELVGKLSNADVAWDGDWIGLKADVVGEAAKELLKLGQAARPVLLAAMGEKDKFATAHVLLTLMDRPGATHGSAGEWNGLEVTLTADHRTLFPPEQIPALAARWRAAAHPATREGRGDAPPIAPDGAMAKRLAKVMGDAREKWSVVVGVALEDGAESATQSGLVGVWQKFTLDKALAGQPLAQQALVLYYYPGPNVPAWRGLDEDPVTHLATVVKLERPVRKGERVIWLVRSRERDPRLDGLAAVIDTPENRTAVAKLLAPATRPTTRAVEPVGAHAATRPAVARGVVDRVLPFSSRPGYNVFLKLDDGSEIMVSYFKPRASWGESEEGFNQELLDAVRKIKTGDVIEVEYRPGQGTEQRIIRFQKIDGAPVVTRPAP